MEVKVEVEQEGRGYVCTRDRSLTLLVTTQVKGREAVVTDSQFLGSRVGGWGEHSNTVVL